jgi:BCCIP
MVNLPVEIVQVLHQQLVLDMDWAVEHAEGGEEERKSLNFEAFVRLAPSYRSSRASYYKYFDDEIFSRRADFDIEKALPKS